MSVMTGATRVRLQQKSPLRQAVDIGLIAGGAAIVIALVGMFESFADRFIVTDALSTAESLLAAIVLLAGYLAASRLRPLGITLAQAAGYGAVAGVATGGLVAALLILGQVINLRAVLVNASPRLWEILSFEQSIPVGVALLVGLGLGLGAIGGALALSRYRIRFAIVNGLLVMVLFGMLRDIIRLVFNQTDTGREAFRFLFTPSNGLTIIGAIIIFALPALLSILWRQSRRQIRARYEALPEPQQRNARWGAIALGVVGLLLYPQIFGRFPSEAMNNVILLGVLMGLGLNIVVGFAGMLDLGYVGFFAIGSYTMAILTSPEVGLTWNFWQALPFAVLVSVLSGIILGIPVLKMRGDYLAIVTLGFGEIIRLLVLSDWLRPYFQGARGITLIKVPEVLGNPLNTPEELYYLLLIAVALTWFVSVRLRDSRIGRAWMAVREDEDVAEAMGIDLVATKLLAFATGAAMAGLGGAIFAAKLQSIVPQTFNLLISVNALSIIIIGGMASVPGVIVGSLLLIGLPELLREFAEFRLWLYGALLVVMMIYKPEGFWPEETRKRELHEHEHDTLVESEAEEPPDFEPVQTLG